MAKALLLTTLFLIPDHSPVLIPVADFPDHETCDRVLPYLRYDGTCRTYIRPLPKPTQP